MDLQRAELVHKSSSQPGLLDFPTDDLSQLHIGLGNISESAIQQYYLVLFFYCRQDPFT
jgi:hypothetical protein